MELRPRPRSFAYWRSSTGGIRLLGNVRISTGETSHKPQGLANLFTLLSRWGAKYAMFPGRIKQDPRVLLLTLLITFISGANFFSVR